MIRLEMELRVDGKRVSSDQWAEAMTRKVKEIAFQKFREKVEAVRCPEHGSTPRFDKEQAAGTHETSLSFACCCEGLRAAALEAVKK